MCGILANVQRRNKWQLVDALDLTGLHPRQRALNEAKGQVGMADYEAFMASLASPHGLRDIGAHFVKVASTSRKKAFARPAKIVEYYCATHDAVANFTLTHLLVET